MHRGTLKKRQLKVDKNMCANFRKSSKCPAVIQNFQSPHVLIKCEIIDVFLNKLEVMTVASFLQQHCPNAYGKKTAASTQLLPTSELKPDSCHRKARPTPIRMFACRKTAP